MTFDSVDLPEPFGPMMACTSPAGISRETPLRISDAALCVEWRSVMTRDMDRSEIGDLKFGTAWRSGGRQFAAEGDFHAGDDGAGRKIEDIGEVHAGLDGHVVDLAADLVVKVAVLLQIRTEAGSLALE